MRKTTLLFTPTKNISMVGARRLFPRAMKYGFLLLLLSGPCLLFGQDLESGIAALEEAGAGIEGYFAPIETIVYIIAGILALVGVSNVYARWQSGNPGAINLAVSWIGSVIFLIVAITIVKSFFGIG